jgi:hypothetical protein
MRRAIRQVLVVEGRAKLSLRKAAKKIESLFKRYSDMLLLAFVVLDLH